jgi:mycoredoxin
MSVNGGNCTVPTVLFDNGMALTNPTIVQIKQRLASMGTPNTV